MKRSLFSYVVRNNFINHSCRHSSGLAVKEETSNEGANLSPEVLEVNSAKPQGIKKQLFVWGLAEHGALGLERLNNKHHKKAQKYKHKPVRNFFGDDNCVTHMACGYGFSVFAVKTNDYFKVYGCGLNTDCQLGYQESVNGQPLGLVLSPSPINLGLKDCRTDIISLSAGRAHVVVVTNNDGVFTLGSNCYGQCGRPVIQDEKYIASSCVHRIENLGREKVISAVCGQDHTLFLTEKGKVFSCGWGADGQTGLGSDENATVPFRVHGDISCECIVKLVSKCDTVLALSNKGEVFGWGNTEYSQLNEPYSDKIVINCPTILHKLRFAGKIVDIAAGGSFCMALNEEGDVFVWGYGILGAGPAVDHSSTPICLPKTLFGFNEFQPDSKILAIECGLSHMAAVSNYFNLYTWGKNRTGCLGVGHIRDQYFPYKVCIGASVEHISCGIDHTMALCSSFV